MKYPAPFIVNFDPNLYEPSKNLSNPSHIFLLNISIIEIEFENLKLSLQREKINELKNQFQLLIKKECYWKQKEITFYKMIRKK